MPGTRRGIYIEFIGDEIKYVRSAENVMATNTKLDRSFKGVAINQKLAAEAQVAAALKAQSALRAQATNLRAVAASSTGEKRATADRLAAQAEAQLAAQLGLTTRAHKTLDEEVQKGERDLNKLARGALAGSGLFAAFGRALAFASTGFIAFAAGATVIRTAFDAATQLLATQRAVDRQLQTQGASWAQYGKQVNATDLELSHVSGFTNQQLLQSFEYLDRVTGNVSAALKLNATAADVARGRNISLSSAALALGKAYGGSITALRRLGIVIPQNVKGMAALDYVSRKFAGQAEANATVAEKFNATLVDSEEIIGTALLPTINKYLTSLGDWFQRMNESGRLQEDVTKTVADFKSILDTVIGVVKTVDRVTGSFKNTLKLLIALQFAKTISGWVGALDLLIGKWTGVKVAATEAAAAESTAVAAGGGAGVAGAAGGAGAAAAEGALAGGAISRLFGRRGTSDVTRRVSMYTRDEKGIAAVGAAATKSQGAIGKLMGSLEGLASTPAIIIPIALAIDQQPAVKDARSFIQRHTGHFGFLFSGPEQALAYGPKSFVNAYHAVTGYDPTARNPPAFQGAPKFPLNPFVLPSQPQQGPFGAARPMTQFFKQFQLSFSLLLKQAEASLTAGNADDVAAAKQIIAKIKRLRDEGRLHGDALIQALGIEAQAIGVLQQAQADAAQKAADAAQKASDAIEKSIDPVGLEIQLAQATLRGLNIIPYLKKLRAAADKVAHSSKASQDQQLEALNRVIDLNQQIKDAAKNQGKQFEVPIKFRMALAQEAAFGKSETATLEKERDWLLKALKSGKYAGEQRIALLQEITNVNEQLQSSAASALGLFKQAKLSKLTGGLGLTREQRKALEGRLSQLGPKGTVPGTGVGAAGYAINPKTDRPIAIHNTISLDGRVVARNTTVHQQRSRRRNPPQRRGPNAGAKVA